MHACNPAMCSTRNSSCTEFTLLPSYTAGHQHPSVPTHLTYVVLAKSNFFLNFMHACSPAERTGSCIEHDQLLLMRAGWQCDWDSCKPEQYGGCQADMQSPL